jgi:gamma-glutamyltranspeptidase/glutathione hydrolase
MIAESSVEASMAWVSEKAPIDLPGAAPGSGNLPWVEAPRRGPVFGSRFAVATDHPLASLAAMNVLQRGGNAADATIAASAVNVVTKPFATQLGGDAFMLVWRRSTNTVTCLNAGGRAPLKATLERFSGSIPALGAASSTVPGLVDAWMQLHQTYGTLPLDVLLQPALDLAENGFPVSTRLHDAMTLLPGFHDRHEAELKRTFLVDGRRPYAAGETLRQPDLAATVKLIVAEVERHGFYEGPTGEAIVRAVREAGGVLDQEDLLQPAADWHEPLMSPYAGYEVYEQAPPSQGVILLEALNIVEHFPLAEWGPASADAQHVLIEATKLAFADRQRYWADPRFDESVPVEQLLSKEFAKRRAKEIDLARAGSPLAAVLNSDTTEFVVGDDDMAVAFIQSVFAVWGSRFVVPGTGILLNNRLSGFSADPAHPNRLEPGKRSVHTLNTFLALRDGQLAIGGGTPGADFQVQSNLQTIVGALTWGLDLQSAIDAPRWVSLAGGKVAIERRYPPETIAELSSRGHEVHVIPSWDTTVSRSQVIASRLEGGWAVASDLRGEGVALGA